MNTPDDLNRLIEAATKGPWLVTERSGYYEILAPDATCDWYGQKNMHAVVYCDTEIDEDEQAANAALIVFAKNNLPDLLKMAASLERLTEKSGKLRDLYLILHKEASRLLERAEMAEARVAALEGALAKAGKDGWCWNADDPETVYGAESEWLEYADLRISDGPHIEEFGWGERAPTTYALFVPPADDDGDWTTNVFFTLADAQAARALLDPSRDGEGK